MADIIGRNTPPGDGDGFKSTTLQHNAAHCSLAWRSRREVSHSMPGPEYTLTLVQIYIPYLACT